jgi:homoserine kinase type II
MSVYTRVDKGQLEAFLHNYQIGELVDFQGIVAGITNTNYFLQSSTGEYVLTLYENHSVETLDYTLGLQYHLASNNVACALPILDNNTRLYSSLNNRPAAIIHRLAGVVCENPTLENCELIGAELARFHLVGRSFTLNRRNPCGFNWCLAICDKLKNHLSDFDRQLLLEEVQFYQQYPMTGLPMGTLHADLFHDNVLFEGNSLSGIIDFDYACNDVLIYDLCITINDWCIETGGGIDRGRMDVLMQAYQQLRPLLEQEQRALPMMFRATALRFWLSRLHDQVFPIAGELTFTKSPDEYKNLLLKHRESAI